MVAVVPKYPKLEVLILDGGFERDGRSGKRSGGNVGGSPFVWFGKIGWVVYPYPYPYTPPYGWEDRPC